MAEPVYRREEKVFDYHDSENYTPWIPYELDVQIPFSNLSLLTLMHNTKQVRLNCFILKFILIATLFSCDGIKQKGRDTVDRSRQKIIAKKDAILDDLIPTFDSYSPDTKFNKKRFEEFFGFAPTSDVKEIYCFGDQMGIDSKFQFSFRCDTATKNRIVKNLALIRTNRPDNSSSGLWKEFSWWDTGKITSINPYRYEVEHKYYRYLWFDDTTYRLHYIEYDM